MASIYGLYDRTGALRYIGKAKAGLVRNESRAKLREAARLRPDLFGQWLNLPDRVEAA